MTDNSKSRFAVYGFLVLSGLVAGYFAGREHLKYEMRSAFESAKTGIVQAMKNPVAPSKTVAAKAAPPPPIAVAPKTEQPLIIASLIGKTFVREDFRKGIYRSSIGLDTLFQNKTDKPIRAFGGVVVITDLLDNVITKLNTQINLPIPANGSLKWDGETEYNEFIDSNRKLASEPKENLKVKFEVKKILFADGTAKTFE